MSNYMFMGNIASGKSAWANVFQQHNYKVEFENLNDVLCLQQYWKNRGFAFKTQISFYSTWLQLYSKVVRHNCGIIDSSIYSHHFIFSELMKSEGVLTDLEFLLCTQLFNSIISMIDCQIVYLYCDLQQNIQRSIKRSRKNEICDKNFITLLHKKYNELYESLKSKIIYIDITHLSVYSEDDFKFFERILRGDNFDNCN